MRILYYILGVIGRHYRILHRRVMIYFKGCLRQKECKKASTKAGRPVGKLCRGPMREKGGWSQGDHGGGGKK